MQVCPGDRSRDLRHYSASLGVVHARRAGMGHTLEDLSA